MIKKMLLKNEIILALIIIALSLLIGTINPAFFSVGNLIDILRTNVVMCILAIGCFIVIVSGGIDVSFTAIAAFAMYATSKMLWLMGFQGTVVVALLIAAGIGLLLGLINAVFISSFKLPTLIVTLGTQSMYRGFLLAFIGSQHIVENLPPGMIEFSKMDIFKFTAGDGSVFGLPWAFMLMVAIVIIGWLLLNYTMLGRGIYALGGDSIAAERAGFNTTAIQYFIYGFVGLISGIAGVIHASLVRVANPFDLVGNEMNVIAAVVLGGARITGGHGTISGTILGVLLVALMNNGLTFMHVPATWQKVVVGLIIIIGTGISAYQERTRAA